MERIIHATYVDGVFKPTEPVDLPMGTQVTLIVTRRSVEFEADPEWEAFERMTEEMAVDSKRTRLTREQLHDRSV